MKHKIIFLFSLLTIQLISCQEKENMTTEKFDWDAQATAPSSYPMVILSPNIFYSNNGEFINLIPNRSNMQDGWDGSARSWSNDPKPVPDHLSILWLSETEMKIYRGEFKLPQEKLYRLFKDGYMIYGQRPDGKDGKEDLHRETYSSITVGLAPQGMVVVWAVGQNVVEIGRYQAEEVDRKEAEKIHLDNFRGAGGENPIPMPRSVEEKELIKRRVSHEVIALALKGKITSNSGMITAFDTIGK